MTKRAEIDAEMLMAYADGELSAPEAKRVERAIATDPVLARQVADHRKRRAMLANGFATVIDRPVPKRLAALLQSGPVVDPNRARAAQMSARARWHPWGKRLGAGIAIAASLAVGMLIGQRIDTGPVDSQSGGLIASHGLARALDTQRASRPGGDASLKILVTFRDHQGAVCRGFSSAALSGIACRDGGSWRLRETRSGMAMGDGHYRQTESTDAGLMADARAMMAGDPLDAAAQAKAQAAGWR